MKVQAIRKGALSYAMIHDFFDPEELEEVRGELAFLKSKSDYAGPNGDAKDENNNSLKSGKGVFVDDLYVGRRKKSPTLNHFGKLFNNPLIGKELTKQEAVFGHIDKCDQDFTLINFYSEGQEYKTHHDTTALTAAVFLKMGDFSGGDFTFPEYGERIVFEDNSAVIFPGCVLHHAEPIVAKPGNFRVSIVKFLSYV